MFFNVATYKNFSTAAQQLYLSQSVVSYHIHTLEKEIGFLLFDRNTHGVTLTLAGASFYKSMIALNLQYEEAIIKAKKIANNNQDILYVCFATPTSPTMIGQIVNKIYSILSNKKIELSKRSYEDVLQPLLSKTADILFTYPAFFREGIGLQYKNVCMTWMSCMMCKQHPLATKEKLTINDLKNETIIFVDSKNARTEYEDIYLLIQQNKKNSPKVELTPKSFDQAQGFAIAGRGILLVRTIDCLYHSNIDGLVSIPLIDIAPIPLIAVWRQNDLCELGKKLIDNTPLFKEM